MVFDQHVCMWFASSSGAFGQYFNLELSLTLLTQISMYGNVWTIIYVRIKVGKYSSPMFHVGLWWLWFSRFPGPTEKGCHCNPWNILGMTPVSSLSQGRTTGYRGCRAVSFFNMGQSFPTKGTDMWIEGGYVCTLFFRDAFLENTIMFIHKIYSDI